MFEPRWFVFFPECFAPQKYSSDLYLGLSHVMETISSNSASPSKYIPIITSNYDFKNKQNVFKILKIIPQTCVKRILSF